MNANHRIQMNYDMLLFFFYVRRMGTLNPRSRVQELSQPVYAKDPVKCSFHFTTFTHASEQKASSLSSCTGIVFLTKLNYPYTLTFINNPTNINFDPNT
jgi:hypothetical protein